MSFGDHPMHTLEPPLGAPACCTSSVGHSMRVCPVRERTPDSSPPWLHLIICYVMEDATDLGVGETARERKT